MKIICFVALTLCALALRAEPHENGLPTISSISKRLELMTVESKLGDNSMIQDLQLRTSDVQHTSLVADTIRNILENFRVVVINGNDDLPPLDPLVVPFLGPYELTVTGIRAMASINNLRMDGLRWYVVDDVNFNALRLSFGVHITIPYLTFTGSYDAQARVALLLTHSAGGNFRIFINRIEVGVDLRLGTNILGGGHLTLRELNIHIDIFDTFINIEGMTGSSLINNFINSLVQGITQDIVQSQVNNVSRLLSAELFDVINDILKEYTISDLFD